MRLCPGCVPIRVPIVQSKIEYHRAQIRDALGFRESSVADGEQMQQWLIVVEEDEDGTSRVNRLNYEVCTLQALREKVRVREIWIKGANRYRDPDNDLPTDFSQKRATYYEALRQPTEADVFIEKLKEDMRKALRSLDAAMPRIRNKVRLLPNRKKKPISITPLAPSRNRAICWASNRKWVPAGL